MRYAHARLAHRHLPSSADAKGKRPASGAEAGGVDAQLPTAAAPPPSGLALLGQDWLERHKDIVEVRGRGGQMQQVPSFLALHCTHAYY